MIPLSRGRGGRTLSAPAVLSVLALLAGMVLVVVALVGQVPPPPAPDASGRPAASVDAAEPVPTTEDPSTKPASVSESPVPTPATTSEPDEAGTPVVVLDRSEPVTVRVPAIGVESPLHGLGLGEDGTLLVPSGDRVDEAAWYTGSPTPGEGGPSVIEGHVTGAGGRPSVFFRLGELRPGDRVEVDRADGSTAVFEVYEVESHPKNRFPTVRVYGNTDGPELRLITCGGEFDEESGHHVDNTVVYARLVPPA